jgi:UDP-N-acetylglucosamine--N-acetylmuramyl-(pentapeptide) pyrophosphoryl-undecaprenol N-acetylglucosamine transferase
VPRLSGRGVVTGNPIRKAFTALGPSEPTAGARRLLVVGGSQGARAINRAVREALPALTSFQAEPGSRGKLVVTHQTGEADLKTVVAAYEAAGLQADVRPFIVEMPGALANADLVVCRCGSTTLAELTAAGRPAVLIPFAAATHDHQTFNARKLAEAGAAIMIREKDLNGAALASAITDLLRDPDRLARMAAASRSLGRPDAAARIVGLCAGLLARGRAA